MKTTPLLCMLAISLLGSLPARAQYTWFNFAGHDGGAGIFDGTGNQAWFNQPYGVAVDKSGNIFVADFANNAIREITSAGVVTTFAGKALSPGSANGTGATARFNGPSSVAVDASGNVYVADSLNNTIRKITSGGTVTTLAGKAGTSGSQNGTGSAARFNQPFGVTVDTAGNVYVADFGNSVIRKITSEGVVTTFAGSVGHPGSNDGTGDHAQFNQPYGVSADWEGNVFVADYANNTIRKITSAGVVTTLAGYAFAVGYADGTGPNASFNGPTCVAADEDGNVFVADSGNNTIRKVTSNGTVTTVGGIAGGGNQGASGVLRFNTPIGVAVDINGLLYVADTANERIAEGASHQSWYATPTLSSNMANMAAGACTGVAATNQDIYFYKGTDNNIWAITWTAEQWTQERLTSGGLVEDWLAYGTSSNLLFYKGTDNQLHALSHNGASWVATELGPKPAGISIVGEIVVDNSKNSVYYLGSDSRVYSAQVVNGHWVQTSLAPHGPANVRSSLAVDPTFRYVYYCGTDSNLWCYYLAGTTWTQSQLSQTANVGGFISVDADGGHVYYRMEFSNSACLVYWDGASWEQAMVDSGADMSLSDTSYSSITPYSQYHTLYVDHNGQCEILYKNGTVWSNELLGGGAAGLTGGLSVQPSSNFVFARRSDGNVMAFLPQ